MRDTVFCPSQGADHLVGGIEYPFYVQFRFIAGRR